MYCVEWKTRNARPAKKSRDDSSPATGRSVKPVQSSKQHTKYEQFTLTVAICNECGQGKMAVVPAGMVSILTMEEFRNVFQLRNIVLPIATVIDEQWEHVIVLLACVRLIQFGQIIEDDAPSLGLFLGVVDARQALAVLIIECNVCKVFSAEIIFADPPELE